MTDRAQLRQQLLASESLGDAMPNYPNESRVQPHAPTYAHAQPAYGYSNHDLMTPVDMGPTPSSRKASMTSSLGVQKLFRRRGAGAAFDDETGADLGEFAGGEMSFSDITHIRGTGGRYNVSLSMPADSSAPIIPVLGSGFGPPSKNMNNIQYRKQMNHQKKLTLAHEARAMSLAGANPMGPDNSRSMSFNNRAMSMEQANGPRTMSLQAGMNRPRPGAGPVPPQGARSPFPGQQMFPSVNPNMGPAGPRAMSLRTQTLSPQQMRGGVLGLRMNSLNGPPGGPRTQSFTGAHANPSLRLSQPGFGPAAYTQARSPQQLYPTSQFPQKLPPQNYPNQHFQNQPVHVPPPTQYGKLPNQSFNQTPNPQFNQLFNQPSSQQFVPQSHGQPPNHKFSNHQYPHQQHVHQYGSSAPNVEESAFRTLDPDRTTSSDSFMNVVEEEAEYEKNEIDSDKSGSDFGEAQAEDSSDQDHVYKFDDEHAPLPSRKSTIKKSDSMRVRRLDFFANGRKNLEDAAAHTYNETDSPDRKNVGYSQRPESQMDGNNVESKNPSESAFESDALKLDTESTNSFRFNISSRSPQEGGDEDNTFSLNRTEKQTKNAIKLNRLAENTIYSKFRSFSQTPISDDIKHKGFQNDKSDSDSEDSVYSAKTSAFSDSLNPLIDPPSSQAQDSDVSKSDFTFSNPKIELAQSTAEGCNKSPTQEGSSDAKFFGDDVNASERSSQADLKLSEIKQEENLSPSDHAVDAILQRRTSTLSRSGSELKLQGILPAGGLITVKNPVSSNEIPKVNEEKTDFSKVKGTLLSSKSKSFIKRFSRTTPKRNATDDEPEPGTPKLRVPSSSSIMSLSDNAARKPLVFTKEELAIMSCNNDLQNELQFITSELALSIKRELALEFQLRNEAKDQKFDVNAYQKEIIEKSKGIADLQQKLNNERRMRFISEEHALLAEHGQSPSALKLDYEKNELCKQLLAMNDLVVQLQEKLEELESSTKKVYDDDLLQKYNELTAENAKLREKMDSINTAKSSEVLEDSRPLDTQEYERAQILALRTQRDELREMITKLTSAQSAELKYAHERVRTLEEKLRKVNLINDKLSKKSERLEISGSLGYGSGGKLHGFDVVTPKKSVLGSK